MPGAGKAPRFAEKETAYIRALAEQSAAVRAIYHDPSDAESFPVNLDRDILLEKRMSPVKGAVYKFPGRLLVLVSVTCFANCRYCERQDRVGVGLDQAGRLSDRDIDQIVAYVRQNAEISEVILSGGDPLTHPSGMERLVRDLSRVPHVRIIRIHTRVPVQAPEHVDFSLMSRIASMFPAPYLGVHIDHPDELTKAAEDVLARLRSIGFILFSQSVFLRGINDDIETLVCLFGRLAEIGVRPYYIYHCQAIPATMRYVLPVAVERALMTQLRERVSGIAYPQHVIDLQHARGKVLVPTEHWQVDLGQVRDYDGNWLDLGRQAMKPTEE